MEIAECGGGTKLRGGLLCCVCVGGSWCWEGTELKSAGQRLLFDVTTMQKQIHCDKQSLAGTKTTKTPDWGTGPWIHCCTNEYSKYNLYRIASTLHAV